MLKKSLNPFLLSAMCSALIFTSCNNTGDVKKTESYEVVTDSLSKIMHERLDQIILDMPLPIDIIKSLYKSGAPYNNKILNTAENSDKYTSRSSKAINMGIYGTDLTYSILYNKQQEALEYLKTSKQFAEDIGIPLAFNNNVMENYEANMNNKDSLIDIVYNSFGNLKKALKMNEQFEISTLIIIGSWIEGLYLSTVNFPADKGKTDELRKKIKEQHSHLSSVLELLEKFQNDEFISEKMLGNQLRLNELKKIENYYNSLSDQNTISDKEIKGLSEILSELRKKITE